MPMHRPRVPPGFGRRSPAGQVGGLLALTALLCAPGARAADAAAADVLFQAAKNLAAEGKYDLACPKFEASFEQDEQLGTLLNVADCYEHLGKLALGWTRWNRALDWARAAGDERLGYIEKRRAELDRRLPRLAVVVTKPVPALQVWRDEVKLDPEMYGLAIPVDPGAHRVVVKRGAQVLTERTASVLEAQAAKIELDLGQIEAKAPPPPVDPWAGPSEDAATAPRPEPAPAGPGESARGATQRTIGWIVAGAGGAAVLTAGGLEIAALVKKGQADRADACVGKLCAPQGMAAADSARTYAEVGQWVGVAGLGALAVGVTILLTAPSPAPPPAASVAGALRLGPWAGPGAAGLWIEGPL
ncbi:MAG: hypothetical protein HY744_08845 [Deltaproteobacteria bacterium]|nr:hypothetical protein [Deltaproteobacteria bacterium]